MPHPTSQLSFSLAIVFLLGCLGLLLHCTNPVKAQAEAQTSPPTDRRSLLNQLSQADTILVVYGDQQAAAYSELLATVQLNRRGKTVTLKGRKASEVSAAEIARVPSLLLGTWTENPWIKHGLSRLPIQLAADGIRFDDISFNTQETIFKLFPYPNPENPQMPIFLITGNNEEAIIQFLKENHGQDWGNIFWGSWGYELYDQGQPKILGYLSDTSWQMDKRIHYAFLKNGDTLANTKHFTFINQQADLTPSAVQQLQAACEANYERILAFTGAKDQSLSIPYHLYPSSEAKGLQLKNTTVAQVDHKTKAVYVVAAEWFSGTTQHLESALLLREVLGTPKWLPFEKGLATFLNPEWFEKGYNHWAQRLYHAEALPTLSQLQQDQWWETTSELVKTISAATFVDFLIAHWGKDEFLKAYAHWTPQTAEIATLTPFWEAFKASRFKEEAIIASNKSNLPYCKGFNFAHEGYRVYNGYGSAQALQSMEKLRQLGTNVIGLVPYSFMRDPNIPSPIPNVEGPGMENDESTVFSHYHAKALGMATMLKPQIWLGGSWPGDISFDTAEKWNIFFDHYSRWIIHYALLAEIHHFDILCIGVEFVKATTQKPEEWRKLIARIRQVYSGPITYAANWGEEFEQLSFWKDLDYIGLNCYYPLSKAEQSNKKVLATAFKDIMKKAEKISREAQRPLLFTEIGFRSIQSPWINPHADADGRSFNEDHQDWCYETVFKAIEGKDWVHGIFWWKWPSYLEYQGRENTSFTPNMKKAEETVRQYFGK